MRRPGGPDQGRGVHDVPPDPLFSSPARIVLPPVVDGPWGGVNLRSVPGDSDKAGMRDSLFRTPGTRVRVKICCIGSIDEARIALEAGADALGLVSAMPSGPGPIAEEEIRRIIAWAGDRADTVLLTSRQTAPGITEQAERLGPSILQLVDELPSDALDELRHSNPGRAIMPVLHVPAGNAVEEARRVAPYSDALLLDSGNPAGVVKELGGTGRVHDWEVSRAIVVASSVPVFLAGGLNAGNVTAAIHAVNPYGVDVCSGVRTAGRLDREKTLTFIQAVRRVTF